MRWRSRIILSRSQRSKIKSSDLFLLCMLLWQLLTQLSYTRKVEKIHHPKVSRDLTASLRQ